MAERRTKELHPALEYLKDNAAVAGLLLVIAVSVAIFVFTSMGGDAEGSEPKATPTSVPTVAIDEAPSPTPSETASSGTESTPTDTDSAEPSIPAEESTAEPSEGPVVGQAPEPGEPEPTYYAGDGPQAVKEQKWQPVAEDFAAAWADPEGGKNEWLKRIKPFVTDRLYKSFEYTDLRQVPDDALDSVSLDEHFPGNISFQAYFEEGGHLFTGLMELQHDGSWLVETIAPPVK